MQKARLLEELGQLRSAGLHWNNVLNYMPESVKRQQHMQQSVLHAQAAVHRNHKTLPGIWRTTSRRCCRGMALARSNGSGTAWTSSPAGAPSPWPGP
ncbi:hypothetical protein H1235_04510 [Pseudoxanthomonas sp. NC8]|nr:hypothetical protein H1235_04510 [Pseudoxanthomonas sp. NC8]